MRLRKPFQQANPREAVWTRFRLRIKIAPFACDACWHPDFSGRNSGGASPSMGAFRRCMLLGMLAAISSFAAAAEFDPALTRVIRHIPRTDGELAALHERSADLACEALAENAPLEIVGFNEPVAHRRSDASHGSSQLTVLESSRRGVLSFGMDMTAADQ